MHECMHIVICFCVRMYTYRCINIPVYVRMYVHTYAWMCKNILLLLLLILLLLIISPFEALSSEASPLKSGNVASTCQQWPDSLSSTVCFRLMSSVKNNVERGINIALINGNVQ